MKAKKLLKLNKKINKLTKKLKRVVSILENQNQSQPKISPKSISTPLKTVKKRGANKTQIIKNILEKDNKWLSTKEVMVILEKDHSDVEFESKNVSAMLCNLTSEGKAEKQRTSEGVRFKIIK